MTDSKSKFDDAAVVDQVLAGKRKRFVALVERYQSAVFGVALSYIGNPAQAEDIVQDTFLKAYESLDRLRDTSKFGHWLLSITRNRCKDLLDKRRRETNFEKNSEQERRAAWPNLERRDIERLVREHMQNLSDDARETLLLYYFASKDTREIAKLQGISVESSRKRLQRARASLGGELEKTLGNDLRSIHFTDRSKPIMLAIASASVAWGSAASASTAVASVGLTGGVKVAISVAAVLALTTTIWMASLFAANPTREVAVSPSASGAVAAQQVVTPDARTVSSEENDVVPSNEEAGNAGVNAAAEVYGPCEISGIVRAANGEAVEGAIVAAIGMKTGYWRTTDSEDVFKIAVTDAEGRYSIEDLPGGTRSMSKTYVVRAHTPAAHAMDRVALLATGGVEEVNLDLVASASISGTVVDTRGEPVPNAIIYPMRHADSEDDSPMVAIATRETTNSSGAFRFDRLREGKWEFAILAQGHAVARTPFVSTGAQDVRVELAHGGKAVGTVTNIDTGDPAPNATVLILEHDPGKRVQILTPWTARFVTTDAFGRYESPNLAPSEYRAYIDCMYEDNYVPVKSGRVAFRIDGSETASVPPINARQGAEIGGRVYDPISDEALAGVAIDVYINGTLAPTPARTHTNTDSRGYYRVGGLPEGVHKITFEGNDQDSRSASVEAGEVITDFNIAYERAEIFAGRVVDTEGRPVRAAVVSVRSTRNVNLEPRLTNASGAFEFLGLRPAKDLIVNVSTNRFRSATVGPIELPREGIVGREFVLDLPRDARLEGTAVDGRGVPLAAAGIIARPLFSKINTGSGGKTGEDGRWKIDRLVAGAYSLRVVSMSEASWSSEHGSDRVEVAPGETLTGIRLVYTDGEGLAISGRVTNARGEAIEFATVSAGKRNARTDADGRYRIVGLDAGMYQLTAWHHQFVTTSIRDVRAGEAAADIVLTPGGVIGGRVIRADTGEPVTDFELTRVPRRVSPMYLHGVGGPFDVHQDDDGVFQIEKVPEGTHTVIVRAPGLALGSAVVENVAPGQPIHSVVIRLEGGRRLEGLVTSEDGAPVVGAKVGSSLYNPPAAGSVLAISNASGAFTLDGLASERALIVAHPDFAPRKIYVGPAAASLVHVQLTRGATIRGLIRLDGAPRRDQYVLVEPVAHQRLPEISAQTDGDGRYTTGEAPPGSVEVSAYFRVSGDTFQQWVLRKRLKVGTGETVEANFDYATGSGVIEGYLSVNGEPAYGDVRVEVETPFGVATSRGRAKLPDGHYRVTRVPAGSVAVQYPYDGSGKRRYEFVVSPDERWEQDIDYTGHGAVDVEPTGVADGEGLRVLLLPGIWSVPPLGSESLHDLLESSVDWVEMETPHVWQFKEIQAGTYTVIALASKLWTPQGIREARGTAAIVEVPDEPVSVAIDF